jgi:uncharacterized heparinase superfamily protein
MTEVGTGGAALRPAFAALPDDEVAEVLMAPDRPRTPPLTPPRPDNVAVARAVAEGRFTLIGETYELGHDPSWQRNPSRDKEWLIAHHKFVWAPDLVHAFRETGDETFLRTWARLVDSWLREMGTGFIAQSDAQVEAKRVEHWIASLGLLRGTEWRGVIDGALLRRMVERLGAEAVYISEHLKPVRNHRTFQLLSVFLVGALYPELDRAEELRSLGRDLLTENLLAEIHPDGVHIELSTHYHQLVCESAVAFAETARAAGVELDAALLERIHRALEFSLWLQWPDGTIPLIGDSDVGDHRPLLARGAALFDDDRLRWGATLGRKGTPPTQRSRAFASTGYAVLRDGWGRDPESYAGRTHVLYDAALLGEGSHSHYDLFSFTLYCDGAPAIVDPGRFTYSSDPDENGVDWRHHFKATAAHNTVTIDALDQTRYLSRTKHGPDVVVEDRAWLLGERSDWIRARARSQEYAPVHERLFLFLAGEVIVIVDRIDPADDEPHRAELRFHLPETEARTVGWDETGGALRVTTERCVLHSLVPDGAVARLDHGWVSRLYGVKHPAPVVSVARAGRGETVFCSVLAPRHVRIDAVERVPVGDGSLSLQVVGSGSAGGFSDTLLVPAAGEAAAAGIAVRGAFAAVRRDAAGRAVHAIGQALEQVTADGAPVIEASEPTDAEWSA